MTTPRPTPGTIIRLPLEKKLDRQLDIARHGALTDRCTVVIERTRTDRHGNAITTPVIEVSPHGDINEIPVPTLRTPLLDLFKAQYAQSLTGDVNEQAARGIDRMTVIAAEAEHQIASMVTAARERAKRDRERRERRRRPAAKKEAA